MFRPATTRLLASSAARAAPRAAAAPVIARRCIGTTPPPAQKPRSWKSLLARVGAAGAIVYYYNTVDVFAEEERQAVIALPTTTESEADISLPTIEDVSRARAQRQQEREAIAAQLEAQQQADQQRLAAQQANDAAAAGGSVEELEEEAGQQGAFNPETGEINWECPCLGGMADGPCGEEFKAAFSCFVYSTEEPKGMDCIEKFKDMQGCFRKYPEVYGSELESDAEDEEDEMAAEGTPAAAETTSAEAELGEEASPSSSSSEAVKAAVSAKQSDLGLVPEAYRPSGETEAPSPRESHDATTAAEKK